MARTIAIVLVAVVFCTSCESPEKAARRHAKWEENIEQARLRVLDQLPDLDAASRDMVRTNRPSIPYVGAPFGGNYWFQWTITSNRVAVLDAFSTPEDVSSKPVTIKNIPERKY